MKKKKIKKIESEFLKQTESFFKYQADGNEEKALIILALDKSTMESAIVGAGTNGILSTLIVDLLTNEDFEQAVDIALARFVKRKMKEIESKH